MRRVGRCRMDIVLVSEVIKEADLWAYPYNALRNQALARAHTDVSPPTESSAARMFALRQIAASGLSVLHSVYMKLGSAGCITQWAAQVVAEMIVIPGRENTIV